MKDWRGVELAPGQLVVYPVSFGSSASRLVIGEIADLVPAPAEPNWTRIPDRVRVKVRERMTGWTMKDEVFVYASRVTVITGVPDA